MTIPELKAALAHDEYVEHQNACEPCRAGQDCGLGTILAVRWQCAEVRAGRIKETAA